MDSNPKMKLNILWIGCSASDNGDGGFDIKTDHAYLENITALRNNRNIRIWSPHTAVIKKATASYAQHRGGIGSAAGLWSSGALDCHFCTLSHNPIQVLAENNGSGALIRLFDSVLCKDNSQKGPELVKEKGTQIELIRTTPCKGDLDA